MGRSSETLPIETMPNMEDRQKLQLHKASRKKSSTRSQSKTGTRHFQMNTPEEKEIKTAMAHMAAKMADLEKELEGKSSSGPATRKVRVASTESDESMHDFEKLGMPGPSGATRTPDLTISRGASLIGN